MNVEELIKLGIEDMSLEEKRALSVWLKGSIKRGRQAERDAETMSAQVRKDILCKILESIVGEPILNASKNFPMPYYRYMVMSVLMKEGYSSSDIGRAFHLSRYVATYACKELNAVLEDKRQYPELIRIWEQFKKEIK